MLANDENSRLAAVEKIPALQTVFDTLGWETRPRS